MGNPLIINLLSMLLIFCIFSLYSEDVIERDGNKPMKSVSGATSTMIKEIHRKPISAAIVKLPSLESSGLIKTADTIVVCFL